MDYLNSNFNNTRKRIIKSIIILSIFVAVLNILVYQISSQISFNKQIKISNDNIAQQFGIGYETLMLYIKENVIRIAKYDLGSSEFLKEPNRSYDFKVALMNKLNNMLMNNYMHSAYIYIPKLGDIYSTQLKDSKINTIETFSDKQIFKRLPTTITILDPRKVTTNKTEQVLITIIAPIRVTDTVDEIYLAVNIDIEELYYTVINNSFNLNKNIDCYAYNKNNIIVVDRDIQNLLRTYIPVENQENKFIFFNKERRVISTYQSKQLNCTFVAESIYELYWAELPIFIICSVFIVVAISLFFIFYIYITTKSFNKIIDLADEKLWFDLLLDHHHSITNDMVSQMDCIGFPLKNRNIVVLLIELNKTTENNATMDTLKDTIHRFGNVLKDNIKLKCITVDKNSLSLLVSFSNRLENHKIETLLLEIASHVLTFIANQKAWIFISSCKERLDMLPLLFKECLEISKYKLSTQNNIIKYNELKTKTENYVYNENFEKQLINNLLLGNEESCLIYLDKIFNSFIVENYIVTDSEILTICYRLQSNLIKAVAGFVMPLKLEIDTNIWDINYIENIKTKFILLIKTLCLEINARDENDIYKSYNFIMDYIEKNFINYDFSLNKASYDLNINKNYLSKIIKDITGDSFPEYINKKRIELAKIYLMDKTKTIEEVSASSGFNYAYYFIKVFKKIEGITPGQFRSKAKNQ